jgi:2-succinyl-6-hydroxy-2,4-cyclohexadiene-1-carboxylate synthase
MSEAPLHIYDGAPKSNRPALLMLHGFMGSGCIFDPFFDQITDFVRPVAVDLMGHGQSPKSADPKDYETARQINQLGQTIAELNLNPFILYGYSMGGRLALQYLLTDYPKPSALILESTHAGIADPKDREQRQRVDAKRAQAITGNFENFLNGWNQAALFQTTAEHQGVLHQRYEQVQRQQDPASMAASLRGFGAGVMPPVWNAIRIWDRPTLILCGSQDEKYRIRTRKLAQAMPDANATHVEIPDAAHRVHADQPEAFINQLQTFITTR